MIDTLKISKQLEAATFSKVQSEAIAEAIAEVTSVNLVTKADLELGLKELELRLSEKIITSERATRTLIFAACGLIVAGVFVNHFWH